MFVSKKLIVIGFSNHCWIIQLLYSSNLNCSISTYGWLRLYILMVRQPWWICKCYCGLWWSRSKISSLLVKGHYEASSSIAFMKIGTHIMHTIRKLTSGTQQTIGLDTKFLLTKRWHVVFRWNLLQTFLCGGTHLQVAIGLHWWTLSHTGVLLKNQDVDFPVLAGHC